MNGAQLRDRSYKQVEIIRQQNLREQRRLSEQLYSGKGMTAAYKAEVASVSFEQKKLKEELAKIKKSTSTTKGKLPPRKKIADMSNDHPQEPMPVVRKTESSVILIDDRKPRIFNKRGDPVSITAGGDQVKSEAPSKAKRLSLHRINSETKIAEDTIQRFNDTFFGNQPQGDLLDNSKPVAKKEKSTVSKDKSQKGNNPQILVTATKQQGPGLNSELDLKTVQENINRRLSSGNTDKTSGQKFQGLHTKIQQPRKLSPIPDVPDSQSESGSMSARSSKKSPEPTKNLLEISSRNTPEPTRKSPEPSRAASELSSISPEPIKSSPEPTKEPQPKETPKLIAFLSAVKTARRVSQAFAKFKNAKVKRLLEEEKYLPDGTLRTMYKVIDFDTSIEEAAKARYVRHKEKAWYEQELSINQIFDHE